MDEKALAYALKLLARRDHSRRELAQKLERRFGSGMESVLDWLAGKCYLDDRRFALGFATSHRRWARPRVDAALEEHGVDSTIRNAVMDEVRWPSVREAVEDRMTRLNVTPPLSPQAAARIAGVLARRGYDPAEIGEELERLL
jgi:regulatory protein